MSTPAFTPSPCERPYFGRKHLLTLGLLTALAFVPFLIWPSLLRGLLARDFLPHAYCYLKSAGLIWTHVIADALIGAAYLAISITLAYLVHKARRDIPFHWVLLAFGLFIVACGGTHLLDVVTVWIPVYVFSAAVKIFTAIASITTAVVLPLVVPRVLALVQQAKATEQATVELRASEERKEALLREVHHRVKNNLAVICSLFYLQANHTEDQGTVQIFQEMENRVHSMALVHESLYRSENLARVEFAEYARTLASDILGSYRNPAASVRLKVELDPVVMSVDQAMPCGLILNELISNSFKHGFPDGTGGEIKVTLHSTSAGACILSVEDSGVGLPFDFDMNNTKSLGLKLVRSLTRQVRGAFELARIGSRTSAQLQFKVDCHVP